MEAHFARYAEAYFKALLYMALQYAVAVVSCPPPAGPGGYAHLVYFARLSTLALPAMLAFMDGSVQRGRSAPPPLPKVDLEEVNRRLAGGQGS